MLDFLHRLFFLSKKEDAPILVPVEITDQAEPLDPEPQTVDEVALATSSHYEDRTKGVEKMEAVESVVAESEDKAKFEDDARFEDVEFEDEPQELAEAQELMASPVPRQGDEIVKDEMNLAEFPIALVSHRVPMITKPDGTKEPIKTIEWNGWATVNGKRVPKKWMITGSDAYGLPTAVDDDAFMAILAAGSRSGFKSRDISLPSIYSLLKTLTSSDGGNHYNRFKQSLLRLHGLNIYTEYAYKDKDGDYVKTNGFHIIEDFQIAERYRPGDKRRKVPAVFGHIKLSDTVYGWIKNGNLKDLNYTTYQKLPTQLSRRLYRYYDKQRFWGESCIRNVFNLCLKLGFAHSSIEKYSPQKFKDLLTSPLDELVLMGFLTGYEWQRNKQRELMLVVVFAEPGSGTPYGLNAEQRAHADILAQDITALCGQAEKNKGFYFKTAALAVKGSYIETVKLALSETQNADVPRGTVVTRSKYFGQRLKALRKTPGN
jgi:hypothetical protein